MDEMPAWLQRLLTIQASRPTLLGALRVRRLKNYAALSGYAYEYKFAGYRDAPAWREYVFQVSGDRKKWFDLSVRLREDARRNWEAAHGRALAANECYALAKLALFSAFDKRANPAALRVPVEIDAAQAADLLARLDL